MSQAIIDFCERLKTTLLGVEERLAKAKESFASGADRVEDEAKKHIDEASEQLRAFKAEAAKMAERVRGELPKDLKEGFADEREKLKEFGLEAQVALRHAAVFLAENAAKGAETAAAALKRSAENLRRETAVTPHEGAPPSS